MGKAGQGDRCIDVVENMRPFLQSQSLTSTVVGGSRACLLPLERIISPKTDIIVSIEKSACQRKY
jgi:hypothetical protein